MLTVIPTFLMLAPCSGIAKDAKDAGNKRYEIRVSSAECFLVKPDGAYWDGTGHAKELIKVGYTAAVASGVGAIPAAVAAVAANVVSDGTKAPDPYYKIRVDGKNPFVSKPVQDSYLPAWPGGTKMFKVAADSTVEIEVLDKDVKNDDTMDVFQIGAGKLAKAAKSGRLTLKGDKGIAELKVEVRAVD
ncbi:MAG: hypothetical protein HY897_23565 [Deltaproteobacteria bacterium]|nr:hypothetical protein [Deltaproteobacteria bacterium]